MTINGTPNSLPPRNDKTLPERADEHGDDPGPKPVTAERAEDAAERANGHRRSLIELAGRVLGSWGSTTRVLMILIVVIAGLWLLNATADFGLIRFGRP